MVLNYRMFTAFEDVDFPAWDSVRRKSGHSIFIDPLLIRANGGEKLQFQAQVVPHGLFGTPVTEPRFDLACVLVPEEDVRALYEDLAAALDAANYHARTGREAKRAKKQLSIKRLFVDFRRGAWFRRDSQSFSLFQTARP